MESFHGALAFTLASKKKLPIIGFRLKYERKAIIWENMWHLFT